MENVDLPQLWNIFNQVCYIRYLQNNTQCYTQCLLRTVVFIFSLPNQLTITSQHQRHHRFCLRLLLKHPDSHALCVLCGHNAMVSGSFKHALGIKKVLRAPLFAVLILHTWLIKCKIFLRSLYIHHLCIAVALMTRLQQSD